MFRKINYQSSIAYLNSLAFLFRESQHIINIARVACGTPYPLGQDKLLDLPKTFAAGVDFQPNRLLDILSGIVQGFAEVIWTEKNKFPRGRAARY